MLFLERPTSEATFAMLPRRFLPSTLPCSAAESEMLPSFFSYMYMSVLLVLRLRGLRCAPGAGWCSCILAVKALFGGGGIKSRPVRGEEVGGGEGTVWEGEIKSIPVTKGRRLMMKNSTESWNYWEATRKTFEKN